MFKANASKEQNTSANQINRIVEGTLIKGDITADSNIRIDGKLIGNLKVNGKLVLGLTGVIEGEIICLNASIEGKIVGQIKVDGLLVLNETANIQGNIKTHKIGVLEGAEFTGQCVMSANAKQPLIEEIKLKSKENPEMVY